MLLVTIKNLQNETFTVECDPNDTVFNLKKVIAETSKIEPKYDAELIKLLCTGKVMEDEETVRTYEIKPDSFLVLVRQKPGKPKPPPKKKYNQGFGGAFNGFGNDPFMASPLKSNAFGNQQFGQMPFGASGPGSNAFSMNQFGSGGLGASGPGSNAFSMNQFGAGGLGATTHSPNPLGQSGFDLGSLSLGEGGLPSSSGASAASNNLADTPPESFSTAEERAQALELLASMGFDKTQSEQALRASFYNVEMAIELITSKKIPKVPTPTSMPVPSQMTKPPSTQSLHTTSSAAAVPAPAPPPLPQPNTGRGMGTNIQEMRQLLETNPERLQMLKDAVKAQHPEIAQLIDSDPQAFLQLLSQATGGDAPTPSASTGTGGASTATSSGVPGGQSGTAVRVTLSTHEQEIIQRLEDMGFERNRAIEAFLACDRNENYAVNYLLQ